MNTLLVLHDPERREESESRKKIQLINTYTSNTIAIKKKKELEIYEDSREKKKEQKIEKKTRSVMKLGILISWLEIFIDRFTDRKLNIYMW